MNEYYYAQPSRVEQERNYWTKLKQLASEDNVLEFYKLYAKYLEWNNVLSPDRKAIYKMANRVVELHKLIANNEGESIEADLIRDELYDYHKLLPHEIVDWLREFSDRLYSLVNKELI